MEVVEGETLAERISTVGRLEVDEAREMARQIAEALEAAHENGVIHRDLKPTNVQVTPDGKVKVLDFGLAKAYEVDGSPSGTSADLSHSPTVAAATQTGVILGTAAYMSPEQARGRPVDKRTDIWAFGCVLYEMLAGRRAFEGETVSDTLAAILKEDPDWGILPAQTPGEIRRLLRRCLAKDPRQRFHDVADVRIEIEDPIDTVQSARPESPVHRMWGLVGLGIGLMAGATATWLGVRAPASRPDGVVRFPVGVEGGLEMRGAECPALALSPDGRTLVFVQQGQLFARSLDDPESKPLEGTEGAQNPFFAPSGSEIGFAQDAMLKTMQLAGGAITEVRGGALGYDWASASWGEDGNIVFRDGGLRFLQRIPASGGAPVRLTTVDQEAGETYHLWPQVLDGGKQVLYTALGESALWEDSKIVIENLETGLRTDVVEQGTYGRFVNTGHVIYADANGTVYAQPFDVSQHRRTGDRFVVETGVLVAQWGGAASFDVSNSGLAAFVHGSHAARKAIWVVGRDGTPQRRIGDPLSGGNVITVSSDGSWIATDINQPMNEDIWLINTETWDRRRLTFHPGFDWNPVWSPDNRQIAYVGWDNQQLKIFTKDVEGGERRELYAGPPDTDLWVTSWSTTGWIAFVQADAGRRDIYAVRVDEPEERIGIAVTESADWFPQFSPDGRWVAYESDDGGGPQIYVAPFPALDNPRQVSIRGGRDPRWSRAGDELYFWTFAREFMVAEVTTGENFTNGTPRTLFTEPNMVDLWAYDVGPDSESFFLSLLNPESRARQIDVTVNWLQDLKFRADIER